MPFVPTLRFAGPQMQPWTKRIRIIEATDLDGQLLGSLVAPRIELRAALVAKRPSDRVVGIGHRHELDRRSLSDAKLVLPGADEICRPATGGVLACSAVAGGLKDGRGDKTETNGTASAATGNALFFLHYPSHNRKSLECNRSVSDCVRYAHPHAGNNAMANDGGLPIGRRIHVTGNSVRRR